jgi:hypothetical protein
MTSLTFLIVISVLVRLALEAIVHLGEAEEQSLATPARAPKPYLLPPPEDGWDARLRAVPTAPDSSAIYKPAPWAEAVVPPTARQTPFLERLEFGDGRPTV